MQAEILNHTYLCVSTQQDSSPGLSAHSTHSTTAASMHAKLWQLPKAAGSSTISACNQHTDLDYRQISRLHPISSFAPQPCVCALLHDTCADYMDKAKGQNLTKHHDIHDGQGSSRFTQYKEPYPATKGCSAADVPRVVALQDYIKEHSPRPSVVATSLCGDDSK